MRFFRRSKEESPAIFQAERILSAYEIYKEIDVKVPKDVVEILYEVVDGFDREFPSKTPEDKTLSDKLSRSLSTSDSSQDITISLSKEDVRQFWQITLAVVSIANQLKANQLTERFNLDDKEGLFWLARDYISLAFINAGGEL